MERDYDFEPKTDEFNKVEDQYMPPSDEGKPSVGGNEQ